MTVMFGSRDVHGNGDEKMQRKLEILQSEILRKTWIKLLK